MNTNTRTLNRASPLLEDNFTVLTVKGEDYYCRPIVGYHGYFASTNGFVLSLISANNTAQRKLDFSNPRVLKGKDNGHGYLQVLLLSGNGGGAWLRVHRLVAQAHLEPPESNLPLQRLQVNHLNKNRSDNRVCNLEWTTAKENSDYNLLHMKCMKEAESLHVQ